MFFTSAIVFAQSATGNPYDSGSYGDGAYGVGVDIIETCELLYSSGSTPQEGYGASWNVIGTGQELLLDATCQDSLLNISAGADLGVFYTYKSGYSWNGSSWQQFAFSGDNPITDWFRNSIASATVARAGDSTYFVAYTCQYIDNAWKCGCSDATCAEAKWQLQAI